MSESKSPVESDTFLLETLFGYRTIRFEKFKEEDVLIENINGSDSEHPYKIRIRGYVVSKDLNGSERIMYETRPLNADEQLEFRALLSWTYGPLDGILDMEFCSDNMQRIF